MPFFFLFIMLILAAIVKSPRVKGFFGEVGVRLALKGLNKEEFHVLHNLTLSDGQKTSQIDHIVIGKNGVFVIETKNYKGWIFGSERNATWTQTIYKSKKRFPNPIRQNFGHLKMVEHHFPGYQHPLISIINFTSNGTLKNIEVHSTGIHVLHTSDLIRTIHSYKDTLLTCEAAAAYAKHLEKQNIKDAKIKKHHIQTIKETQQKKKAQVNASICPKCGNALVTRNGKHGQFTGCSAFPKCRFTA